MVAGTGGQADGEQHGEGDQRARADDGVDATGGEPGGGDRHHLPPGHAPIAASLARPRHRRRRTAESISSQGGVERTGDHVPVRARETSGSGEHRLHRSQQAEDGDGDGAPQAGPEPVGRPGSVSAIRGRPPRQRRARRPARAHRRADGRARGRAAGSRARPAGRRTSPRRSGCQRPLSPIADRSRGLGAALDQSQAGRAVAGRPRQGQAHVRGHSGEDERSGTERVRRGGRRPARRTRRSPVRLA